MKHLAIAEIELHDARDEVKVRDILDRLVGTGMFAGFTWNVVDVEEDLVLKPEVYNRTKIHRIFYNGVFIGFVIPKEGAFFAVTEIVKRNPDAPVTETYPNAHAAASVLVGRMRKTGEII